jgi:putative ABC transport system ATP-binding protein
MLKAVEVTMKYGKGKAATLPLRDASLTLGAEPVALTGPSGSGKSTLLRILAGMQKPTSGRVDIDGKPVNAADLGTTDARVAMIHQDFRLVDFLTVGENLSLASELRGGNLNVDHAEECLGQVGLSGFQDRRPATLSGGEQQRVAIARALLTNCRVLLADEPTGALDADNSAHIAGLLADLARTRGLLVLVATHDPVVAQAMSRRLSLAAGTITEQHASADVAV